jgi:hypothetical protein
MTLIPYIGKQKKLKLDAETPSASDRRKVMQSFQCK